MILHMLKPISYGVVLFHYKFWSHMWYDVVLLDSSFIDDNEWTYNFIGNNERKDQLDRNVKV